MNKVLRDRIWDDVSCGYTPDKAILRYNGPIPVLFYGALNQWAFNTNLMKELNLQAGEDYELVNYNTKTSGRFILTHGDPKKSGMPYDDYLLDPDEFQKMSLQAYPVSGRLLTMSLHGLSLLDLYFFNGHRANRRLVKIEKTVNSGVTYEHAYVYIFMRNKVGTEKGLSYEFKGDVRPRPLVMYNNKRYYN